jgi:hypothetical protein
LRIGASQFVSFGPGGTGTSGTLYLSTREGRQLAVRLLGATGRIRVLAFQPATGHWEPR